MKTFTRILIAAGVAMLLSSCGVYHGIERVERIDYRTQYRIDRMADHGYYRIDHYYRRRPATPPQRPSTMQPWRRDYGYEKANPYRPNPGMAPGNGNAPGSVKPQNETHSTGINTVHTEILHPESVGNGAKVNPETYHKSPVNTGNSGSTKPAEPVKPAAVPTSTPTSTSRSSSTSSATPASTTTSTHSSSTSRSASTSSSSTSTSTRSATASGSSASRTSSSTSSITPKSSTSTSGSSTSSSSRSSSASRSSSSSSRTSSSSTGSSSATTSSTSTSTPASTSSTSSSTSTSRSSSGSRR